MILSISTWGAHCTPLCCIFSMHNVALGCEGMNVVSRQRRGCVSIYRNGSVPDLAYVFKVVPEWNCSSSFAIQDSLLACNGVRDCENGKDEQNCTHSKAPLLNNFFLSFIDLNSGSFIQMVKRHCQISLGLCNSIQFF